MEQKTTYALIIGAGAMLLLVLALFAGYTLALSGSDTGFEKGTSSSSASSSNKVLSSPADMAPVVDGVQKTSLSMKGYTYIFSPSTFKKGVPVEVTVDLSTVRGCMRDIIIPSLNFEKYVSAGDTTFTFTPNTAGTIAIYCSMRMGRGSFTVVEADGTLPSSATSASSTPTNTETKTAALTAGTCGAGALNAGAKAASGGCGATADGTGSAGGCGCGGGLGGCGCGGAR